MRFQDAAGVFADGEAGPITNSFAKALGFQGFDEASAEMQALADAAGIGPDIFEAMSIAGSNGDSRSFTFDPAEFSKARPGLKDQTPTGRSWESFTEARALDHREAIKASFWGAYKINGDYLLRLYSFSGDAVEAFDRDPEKVSLELLSAWFTDHRAARFAANEKPPKFAALAREFCGKYYAGGGLHFRIEAAWKNKQAERGHQSKGAIG